MRSTAELSAPCRRRAPARGTRYRPEAKGRRSPLSHQHWRSRLHRAPPIVACLCRGTSRHGSFPSGRQALHTRRRQSPPRPRARQDRKRQEPKKKAFQRSCGCLVAVRNLGKGTCPCRFQGKLPARWPYWSKLRRSILSTVYPWPLALRWFGPECSIATEACIQRRLMPDPNLQLSPARKPK